MPSISYRRLYNSTPLRHTRNRHGTPRVIGKTTLSKRDLGIATPRRWRAREARSTVRAELGCDRLDQAFALDGTHYGPAPTPAPQPRVNRRMRRKGYRG